MSIKLKLTILFLAIALIPLLLVSTMTFHNYRDSLEAIRFSQVVDLSSYKAKSIEAYFAGLKTNMEVAQTLYNIKRNLPVIERFVTNPQSPEYKAAKKMLDGQLPHMQSVIGLVDIKLFDLEGKIVYSSNQQNLQNDFSSGLPDAAQKAVTAGKQQIFFSDVFVNSRQENRYEMLITGPALDLGGAPLGVISLEIDMAQIYKIIQDTTGLGKTGETLIGKKKGTEVVFLNPLRHDLTAALNRHVDLGDQIGLPIQAAVQGRNGSGQLVDYRGHKVISAWRYLPSLDWGLVTKIDADEAFADVINLKRLVVIILLVVLALSSVIALSLAHSIASPIKSLSHAVEVVGKGNLDYSISLNSKDEIGKLAFSFDKMIRDLRKITASRDELDQEINERRKVEADLKRSNENLEQFAYVASHDLQEPLRVMSSYAQLLEKRYKNKLDSDANEFIDFIVDAAVRMQRLITDLLAYSRVGRRDVASSDVDFNDLLDRVIASMSLTIASAGAKITHAHLPVLKVHELSFIQLFQNLLSNALKFRGQEPPVIQVSAKQLDGQWEFCVKDNGIGIEAQYHERIFQIFQRLHARDEYPGTGIGLSICKKIVEASGGKMWVESTLKKGSTFYFTVPIERGQNG